MNMHPKIQSIIHSEEERQRNTLGLIPSENYTSKAVREAVGSVLMHKYSEGYPGARYYEGNENIDELESFCIQMCLKVMLKHDSSEVQNDWHANVQVLSGSAANLAVYNAILKPGDKILGMYLPDGGHLSHGWSYNSAKRREITNLEQEQPNPNTEHRTLNTDMVYRGGNRKVNFTSKLFNVVQYKTDPETNLLDYDQIEALALAEQPRLIITGGTAYPQEIDYGRMQEIADKVGAYYHADVAHEAGLIAGGAVNSPFEFAHFVTFTTHKTLRGPRGAVAMCRKDLAKKLDKSVFPGLQGGPFEHNIAGIAQAFVEADTSEFEEYAHQIVKNAQVFAVELMNKGFRVISSGTNKHLILAEVQESKGISGKYLARALAKAGIIANMNTVPYEKGAPANPSGIRFGTPIMTTRGMKEPEMVAVVNLIDHVTQEASKYADLKFEDFNAQLENNEVIKTVLKDVRLICEKFPLE
jgi:glycine hydroxymethyltransferase